MKYMKDMKDMSMKDKAYDMNTEAMQDINAIADAAMKGNVRAMTQFGKCNYFGKGTEQNYDVACRWFKAGAERGDAEAQYFFACCCFNGDGTEQDMNEAARMYKEAARQGHTLAKYCMGLCRSTEAAAQPAGAASQGSGLRVYFGDGYVVWAWSVKQQHRNCCDKSSCEGLKKAA